MTNKQKALELLENIYPEARQQIIETAQKITSEIQNTNVKLTSGEIVLILDLSRLALGERDNDLDNVRDNMIISRREEMSK